jgi:hypothetical protein
MIRSEKNIQQKKRAKRKESLSGIDYAYKKTDKKTDKKF